MSTPKISLDDRFDLSMNEILLSGTQALVRLMMTQRAKDRANGFRTAGYVTGYRGSPLGAVDVQMQRAEKFLTANTITFQPALNEDLAATALWGTQQAELRGEGKFEGVFGLWYGKGPGVDRSGDAMRHVNMAGTSALGGVLMAMGDDHTGESSTVCHQSDLSAINAHMPVLSPAGVQEILDYGMYGFALSRFSGLWCGLKLMKDTVEVTSVVDANLRRYRFVTPQIEMPEGGLNIRLIDHWVPQEERLYKHKRFAAEEFARANQIDKRVWGKHGAKIGFVAAGKNWLDLAHALEILGIDDQEALNLGLTTYKIGQTWPLDAHSFRYWADALDLIVVVEEKQKVLESQIKDAIFATRHKCRVYGWRKNGGPNGDLELFPTHGTLDPTIIAAKIGRILIEEGRGTDSIRACLSKIADLNSAKPGPDLATRRPYFCAGCPHNTSTKLPEGSRAYSGIGCHTMVLWMDRNTIGYTHMGAEGANWIGESQFSETGHVFQNMGDGTYNHSGIMSIRAAVAAGTTITYKILYNDAVAMTGGQANDGGLGPEKIAHEVLAAGVAALKVVYDDTEDLDKSKFPTGTSFYTRDLLEEVQEECREIEGVSVLLYVQTCAAEKRRRRKRGTFPDPDKRVFIDSDVCEGCGDCGVQSNCVAVLPFETDFGRKRQIDQSTCNKDFSCVNGFCPSFVTIEGAQVKKNDPTDLDFPDLPEPKFPRLNGTHNIVVTGIGGTGVVTIGAILAQAAFLDDLGVGMMEMAGLAQKGGPVQLHCRIGRYAEDITAIRVSLGEADAIIGGDIVTTAHSDTDVLMDKGRTSAVVNTHEVMTGEFTRETDFRIPTDQLKLKIERKIGRKVKFFDAHKIAETLMGDSIYTNMILLGAAWQNGLLPLSFESLYDSIELNGTDVENNLQAFELGRWAAHDIGSLLLKMPKAEDLKLLTLDERIMRRVDHIQAYQSKALARKYLKTVNAAPNEAMREAIALGYHKALTYKDEFEVARLLLRTEDKLKEKFEGDFVLQYNLAHPFFAKKSPDGRPSKRQFGPWVNKVMRVLAKLKFLRNTVFNPFRYTEDRKLERELLTQYEEDLAMIFSHYSAEKQQVCVALAKLPLQILGFGPVKKKSADKASLVRDRLLTQFRAGGVGFPSAAE